MLQIWFHRCPTEHGWRFQFGINAFCLFICLPLPWLKTIFSRARFTDWGATRTYWKSHNIEVTCWWFNSFHSYSCSPKSKQLPPLHHLWTAAWQQREGKTPFWQEGTFGRTRLRSGRWWGEEGRTINTNTEEMWVKKKQPQQPGANAAQPKGGFVDFPIS